MHRDILANSSETLRKPRGIFEALGGPSCPNPRNEAQQCHSGAVAGRGEKPLSPEESLALVEKSRAQMNAASKEYLSHRLDGEKAHMIRNRMMARLDDENDLPSNFKPNQVELGPTMDEEIRRKWSELGTQLPAEPPRRGEADGSS